MDEIVLDITNQMIDDGIPNSGGRCPIALALRQHLAPDYPDEDGNIEVDPYIIVWWDFEQGKTMSADLPWEVGMFVERFDKGEEVLPMTLHLTPRQYGGFAFTGEDVQPENEPAQLEAVNA